MIEYDPKNGALTATGIQTATIKATVKILFDSPEVECTTLLKTATLEVTKGGTMKGNVTHSGGSLISNGVVVDDLDHGGVQRGSSRMDGPQ